MYRKLPNAISPRKILCQLVANLGDRSDGGRDIWPDPPGSATVITRWSKNFDDIYVHSFRIQCKVTGRRTDKMIYQLPADS